MLKVVVLVLLVAFCISQRIIQGTVRNTFQAPLKLVDYKLDNPTKTKIEIEKSIPVSKKSFKAFEIVGTEGITGVANYISDDTMEVKVALKFTNTKTGGNYTVDIDPGMFMQYVFNSHRSTMDWWRGLGKRSTGKFRH